MICRIIGPRGTDFVTTALGADSCEVPGVAAARGAGDAGVITGGPALPGATSNV